MFKRGFNILILEKESEGHGRRDGPGCHRRHEGGGADGADHEGRKPEDRREVFAAADWTALC